MTDSKCVRARIEMAELKIKNNEYQEAIELLLLTFYDGYIPMNIIQSVLDRFSFPKEN